MTGASLALQELLYGFIMALILVTAARIGLVHYADREGLVILITGMNLTWGAIDAVIYYLLNVFEQRRFVRLMSMPDGPDREGGWT